MSSKQPHSKPDDWEQVSNQGDGQTICRSSDIKLNVPMRNDPSSPC
jgi:hypothetical protein